MFDLSIGQGIYLDLICISQAIHQALTIWMHEWCFRAQEARQIEEIKAETWHCDDNTIIMKLCAVI